MQAGNVIVMTLEAETSEVGYRGGFRISLGLFCASRLDKWKNTHD